MWLLACLPGFAQPAFATLPPHELASLHAQLAIEYAKAGQYGMALDSAERAVTIDQNYAPAWLARAYVESVLAHDDIAEHDYRKALELEPANAEANNNFGQFLCERGKAGEAMGYLSHALTDPLYVSPQTAYFNLGHCSRKLDQPEAAKNYLLAALRLAPDYVPALKDLVALYLEQGSVKLASFYYDRLIRHAETLGPDDLLMGIEVARLSGDRVREARYAALLQSRYPDSKETQQLLSGT
jgi:type IV pilus assembly protein PilF